MNKKGVSLIVLAITIIVTIILAGIVILNLKEDNSIQEADKVVFQTEVTEMSKELSLSLSAMELEDETFDRYLVNEIQVNKIRLYIKKFPTKYENVFVIEKGKLKYVGTDSLETEWIKEIENSY
ncbi:MAG: hypothetical protein RR922_06005 [Clostridia bacterium]